MKTALLFVLIFFLTGCADAPSFSEAASIDPVGFWRGLWHGMISPIALVVSWFDSDVAIYAIYNNGGWYDFGFLWGVGMSGGSTAAAASNRK